MPVLVLDQGIEEELHRALEDRIGFPEMFGVARVEIVLPKMLAKPCATGRPHSPLRPVNRRGAAPEVRVVMGDPATGPVVDLRRVPSRRLQLTDHAQQWFVAFAQVADLRHPVVHLDVDVDGVLAPPGRVDLVVPDALQVQGLRPGPRPGDHQIAAILEELFGEQRIGCSLDHSLQPFIGGDHRGRFSAQVDRDPVEERGVVLHMILVDLLPGLPVDSCAGPSPPSRRDPR